MILDYGDYDYEVDDCEELEKASKRIIRNYYILNDCLKDEAKEKAKIIYDFLNDNDLLDEFEEKFEEDFKEYFEYDAEQSHKNDLDYENDRYSFNSDFERSRGL